jgi:ribonuclease HI
VGRYYVVWKGRQTGVFGSWAEAEAQVKGFPGARYKAFASLAEAQRALLRGPEEHPRPRPRRRPSGPPPIIPSLAVDAACSGNPGQLEYRGVETATGRELFRQGPLQGTNNVGEFLAIVEALRLCKERGWDWPIYTDSLNAIRWVKGKRARTGLDRTPANAELFERIAEAEAWLRANAYTNPILKWQTERWGENPADFGRK